MEKDGKYAIMDYTGKVIVDYEKYEYIDDLDMSYATYNEEGKNILLDINGNVIDGISYDRITNDLLNAGIYISNENYVEENWKKGIITCSGCIVAEPKYDRMVEIDMWDKGNVIYVKAANDWYVIDKQNYELKFSISGDNIAQADHSENALIDLEKNIFYVFDDNADTYIKLADYIKEDLNWNEQQSYYYGVDLTNKLTEYGYLIYEYSDGKYGVVYKDGTILTKEISLKEGIFGNSPDYYIGEDYIFIQVGTNVEVYNGNKKVVTIENKKIIPDDNILKYIRIGSDKIIPIMNNDDECVYLYNEKGELINNKKYGYPSSVLETVDGSERVKLTPDGKFLDANEFADIELLYNKELGEYANNYFVGLVEKQIDNIRTEKKYYLINNKSEKLFEISGTTFTTIYEKDNILLYSKGINDEMNRVYDLKNNKEILALEDPIEYISDYKVFISNSNIYSLSGQLIGNY